MPKSKPSDSTPLAFCQRLDRFDRGNRKAFGTVRIPHKKEKCGQAVSRQHRQLVRVPQRRQAMGRNLRSSHSTHVLEP